MNKNSFTGGAHGVAILTSSNFQTNRDWHEAVVSGTYVILRRTSALEFLQLFGGYFGEKEIDVYALNKGIYSNVNYHIVKSFDGIDYFRLNGVLCTTPNFTFNDMLANYDEVDEQALMEGLARYYFSHEESFAGLEIKPENLALFNKIKAWAAEYYDEG
jgi:hypothetical protein